MCSANLHQIRDPDSTSDLLRIEFRQLLFPHRSNVATESDMSITSIDPELHDGRRLAVEMTASYGMDAAFECVRCAVVDAVPYEVAAEDDGTGETRPS